MSFKLLSLNARGLGNQKKRRSLFRWVKSNNCDVIFLQETHGTSKSENQWLNEWNGRVFFSHGNSSSRGCAILFKRNLEVDEVELIYSSTDGRILMVGATIKQTSFKFINVYAPNITAQQIEFFASLQLLVEKHLLLQDRIILGGDLNIIFDTILDKKGGRAEIKKQVVDKFMKIVDHLDLIDIFRIRNPEKKCYTWRQKKENIATRLDYW